MSPTRTHTTAPTATRTPTRTPTSTPTLNSSGSPISIQLTPSRTSCIAPCGVYFDASETTASTTSQPFQELHFEWNFGDPTASFNNQPNVDANYAEGGVAAHVFATPGNYRVTLVVNDLQGNQASRTVDIQVADPEVAFHPQNGGHTYCVSTNGDFSGCPSTDPQHHFTSYIDALNAGTLCISYTGNSPPHGPRRLLLKRGQTFTGTVGIPGCLPYTEGEYDNDPLMLGAFGSGPDPIIQSPPTNELVVSSWLFGYHTGPLAGTTVTNIAFKGPYDAATGLGSQLGGCLGFWGTGLTRTTIYRNSFDGCVINLDVRSDTPTYAVIADNTNTNWQNFGIFGSLPYGALLANIVEQNPNTLSVNWDGKWGCMQSGICGSDFPDHGAVRIGLSTHAVLSFNHFTSRNSWIGLGSQPSLRFGSEGDADLTHAIVSHNRLIPGTGSGGSSEGTHVKAGSVTDVIWDSNLVVLKEGDYYGSCIATNFGGTTYRNNICLKLPSNREYPLFGSSGFLESMFQVFSPGPLNESTIAIPNRYYHNMLISLDEKPANQYQPMYDDAFIMVRSNGSATPYVFDVKNNIIKAPQLANMIAYWFFNHGDLGKNLGFPASITSARNFFSVASYRASPDRYFNYPWDFWGPGGQSSNSLQDPELASIPAVCRPSMTKLLDVTNATVSGDGVRSYVTKAGANFGGLKVLRNSRITISNSSGGPESLHGGADYHALDGMNVYDSNGDVLTLAHDIRADRTRSFQIDLKVNYSPSTASKIYVFDNSVFAVGDKITYDLESTTRTISSVGADGEGQYVTITPSLPTRSTSFICKWAPGSTPGLNLHLSNNSPARASGYAVPVFSDYQSASRPSGLSWDVGPFEDE